ncbi:DUF3822 family protein [Dysgonomonas sp. 511]|uniref:DUF3822 family protein n=1 Tax=Dysgonomonas sp. 511 TaxID=2302930 RepID=UPI0013D687DC|nr:DUF3822 family protein [Dysgonomonas sp. 511]NDV78694.1 DUF3822 family protein [Dysgonomonas sp. 511]
MFLPENIDLGKSEKYILSLRVKPNGFMFSITDPDMGNNYCLRETTFRPGDDLLTNVQRIIFDFNFLTQIFRQTNVVIVSKDYEMVPAEFYDKKKQQNFYDFTHTNKSGHIQSALFERQDIVMLYNIEDDLFSFLSRNLWNPHFFHHSQLLINTFEEKARISGEGNKMFVNFHTDFTDVICFQGATLLHSLTYENEPPANTLYYILKIWEQCGFDQMNDTLYLAGKADSRLSEKLYQYINNIEIIGLPQEIHFWSEDARKAPLDLLSLSLPL